jgi:hypothetical protein
MQPPSHQFIVCAAAIARTAATVSSLLISPDAVEAAIGFNRKSGASGQAIWELDLAALQTKTRHECIF